MAARMSRLCPCGKIRFRNEGHARRQLDAARQAAARLGQPEPTWVAHVYRCRNPAAPAGVWHHASNREARLAHLHRNHGRLEALLARGCPNRAA